MKLFKAFKKPIWEKYSKKIDARKMGTALSFSQSGEDMVIRSLNRRKRNGFFVDIGAHHPIWYSNTYHFYLNGWKGINVDPIPGVMKLFDLIRPNDINLEIACGKVGVSSFNIFEDGAYNTFDQSIAKHLINTKVSNLIKTIEIKKHTLSQILDLYLPKNTIIDLLSIDAEGMDVEILETNDWDKYRPLFVCAECHTADDARPMNPRLVLESKGYEFIAKTEFSAIYRLNN